MKLFKFLDQSLAKLEIGILSILIFFMFSLAFLQLILRAFFNSGVMWADEILRHSVLLVCFIGASLASKYDRHIRMDILTRFVSEKGKWVLEFVSHCASFIICVVLTRSSLLFVLGEYKTHSTLDVGVPAWMIQAIIPLGFGLMSFRFLLKFIETVLSIYQEKKI